MNLIRYVALVYMLVGMAIAMATVTLWINTPVLVPMECER